MTREEQIRKSVSDYINSEDPLLVNCGEYSFLKGIEWADKNPIKPKYPASEKPDKNLEIICLDVYNDFHLGTFDESKENPNLSSVYSHGEVMCYWNEVKEWKYLTDLW